MQAGFEDSVVHNSVVGVSGNVEDFKIRAGFQDLVGQLLPVHPRHHYIRDQQANFVLIRFAEFQCLFGSSATSTLYPQCASTDELSCRICSSSSTSRIVSVPRSTRLPVVSIAPASGG